MKFNLQKKYFKKLWISSTLVCVSPIMLTTISCSSNDDISKLNQQDIDQQYLFFYQSIVKEEIQNNLYFENFNFAENNQIYLSLDEINNYISLPQLSDAYDYRFKIEKYNENNQNSINIEMQMQMKNSKDKTFSLNPTNSIYKTKIIKNVKNLSEENKLKIQNVYQNWKNNSDGKIVIKNTDTNEILSIDKYSNVLPSYLRLDNIQIESAKVNIDASDIFKSVQKIDFNDLEGKITITLSIIDKVTNLPFYLGEESNSKVIVENFARKIERDKEVKQIYESLSGTFDLDTLTNDKKIPFLSSGINSIEKIKQFYNAIIQIKESEKLSNALKIINDQNTSWYKLEISTTANDINGNLTINWTIIDKFSSYVIKPQNPLKSTTFNKMIQLVNQNPTSPEDKDYYQIDNVFKVYSLLRTLELNDKSNEHYKIKPSSFIQNSTSQVNNNWLLQNTNIKELFPNIVEKGGYLSFSYGLANGKKNNFQFKVDSNSLLSSNDINGVLSINFILQIEIEVNSVNHFIDVLPPEKIDGSGDYTSAIRESFIQIGKFLTEDIENSWIIYDYLEKNNNIIIEIKGQPYSYFEDLINECAYDDSKVPQLLKEEIKEFIIKNTAEKDRENVKKLLKKYDLNFNFVKSPIIVDVNTKKEFSTKLVATNLVSTSENGYTYVIPYINIQTGMIQTEFPKVQITVKYLG